MADNDLKVRRAVLADEKLLVELWLEFLAEQSAMDDRLKVSDDVAQRWHNDFPEWIHRESRLVWVAEVNSQLVGFLTGQRYTPAPIYNWTPELHIDEVYVRPDYRSHGAGKALVEAARQWASENRLARLRLVVLSQNREGREFWAAVGGRPLTETYTIDVQPVTTEPERKRGTLGFVPSP